MYTLEKISNFNVIRINQPKAEIELNNVDELKKLIEELMRKGIKKILIDLKNVVYIDSSGLGVFIETVKRLREIKGELGILSISRDLLEVLTATKVGQYFKFYKKL